MVEARKGARSRLAVRTRARTPQAKEELRELILREAVALFVEEGYAGFSMRELGRRLHYSAPTLYGYFANKHDLLLAIIGEGYDVFRSHVIGSPDHPVESLEALGSAYMDFAFKNPMLYKLMFIHRPGALFDLSEEIVQERFGIMAAALRNVRKAPVFARMDRASADQTITLLWALAHGLVSLALNVPVFDEAWARRNLAFLLRSPGPLVVRFDSRGGQVPG